MPPQRPTPRKFAANRSSFVPPPLDGSLSIPEIYDYHYHHNGEHPLFLYDDRDRNIQTVQWKQAVQAIHTAAKMVQSIPTLAASQSREAPRVIGILAVMDQLSYFALTAGIMRAGYQAFPISPRNSDLGVANLVQKMQVKHLFVSKDQAMQRIATSACQILLSENESPFHVELLPTPAFNSLYSKKVIHKFQLLPPMIKQDIHDTILILHSSGSTSFPKPIPLSHITLIQWGSQPNYGDTDIAGRVLSNHALPFFHAMGVVSLTWATMTGVSLSNFAPTDPPVVSTPDSVYDSSTRTNSNLIFCVPAFLEEWSQSPERLKGLQNFDAVLFGGAPIQKAVGDMLYNKGVQLFPFYGATELGGTSKFLLACPPSEGWEYFKISSHTSPVFVEQEQSIFRLYFNQCASHKPAVINTRISETDSYDTNDLLISHPTNPDLWKIFGRADDQIMHSTGEKTNPVPMENMINKHPMIECSLMFGRGRFQAGVLIEPTPENRFDPTDKEKLMAFRDFVWPVVEQANQFGPSHSRIFKEMIIVTLPSKSFKYTAKGTPRRQVMLNEYDEEIKDAYLATEGSSHTDIELPNSYTFEECLIFIRRLVSQIVSVSVKDDEDLFQSGCDSLQATWIRNALLNALRRLKSNLTKEIPVNFVYLNPTIQFLAQYISRIANNDVDVFADPSTKTKAEMLALVDKYASEFPQHQPLQDCPDGEIVLLTGSTGGLGSYILESLILDSQITRIYAFNRKDKAVRSSRIRQEAAFMDRSIDILLLDSPKLIFIEGDTNLDRLGLTDEVYNMLCCNVTCIFHTAWRVDFNVALTSMEPLVAGTRRLVDLALSSTFKYPCRFVFTSSIGVVRNWTTGFVPETSLGDPAIAVGSGYPESKWVAERVLTRAAAVTTLRPVIVRIGQLSGGRNGSWNSAEWVPSIIRSGPVLGCLPRAPGYISWLPVHIAAVALVEIRKTRHQFLHLVHPNPVSWEAVFEHISEAFQVPLVPYSDWLSNLELSNEVLESNGLQTNPALRLLDFYQSANKPLPSNDAEAFGFPRLSTAFAVNSAPVLHPTSLKQLGSQDVKQWIAYWNSVE